MIAKVRNGQTLTIWDRFLSVGKLLLVVLGFAACCIVPVLVVMARGRQPSDPSSIDNWPLWLRILCGALCLLYVVVRVWFWFQPRTDKPIRQWRPIRRSLPIVPSQQPGHGHSQPIEKEESSSSGPGRFLIRFRGRLAR